MLKRAITILLISISGNINLFAADFSGYITAKIDSFRCEMNQNNEPVLILKSKITRQYGLTKDYNVFTNSLANTVLCYDLSSFNKYLIENNNEIQIWLQTYQTEVFRINPLDTHCSQFIEERVYIAIFNGIPKAISSKSLPVYSTNSIFIKNVAEEMCLEEPTNDL